MSHRGSRRKQSQGAWSFAEDGESGEARARGRQGGSVGSAGGATPSLGFVQRKWRKPLKGLREGSPSWGGMKERGVLVGCPKNPGSNWWWLVEVVAGGGGGRGERSPTSHVDT